MQITVISRLMDPISNTPLTLVDTTELQVIICIVKCGTSAEQIYMLYFRLKSIFKPFAYKPRPRQYFFILFQERVGHDVTEKGSPQK